MTAPSPALSPLLQAALDEARPLVAERGWHLPSADTLREGLRLLDLVGAAWPPPGVQVEADGSLLFSWEAGERGWLAFTLSGTGVLAHSGVIDGDDYAQDEPFGEHLHLPDWAGELLHRLWGHLQ